jgi:hypothetical protein
VTATVYTNIVGTQNARQYAMTQAEVGTVLSSLGVVTTTILSQTLASYVLTSALQTTLTGYVTTTTLAATLATFPQLAANNAWTGSNQFSLGVEFATLPWADASYYGASSAASANTNTAAIQAAIDWANTNHGGGYALVPPGNFQTNAAGLTLKGGVILMGSGQNACLINGAGQDTTVITCDSTCNFAELRDISVNGYLSTLATNNAVVIVTNAVVNMRNVRIAGGNYGLTNAGNSGRLYNVSVIGFNSGNVYSSGSNWYTDCQFDSGGLTTTYGFYRGTPAYVGAVEDQIVDCDFSGNYTYSFYANDGTAHQAKTKLLGCILSSPIAVLNHNWTAFIGCEFGTGSGWTVTPTNPVTLVGNYLQGNGTLTLAGANVLLSANYNIVS